MLVPHSAHSVRTRDLVYSIAPGRQSLPSAYGGTGRRPTSGGSRGCCTDALFPSANAALDFSRKYEKAAVPSGRRLSLVCFNEYRPSGSRHWYLCSRNHKHCRYKYGLPYVLLHSPLQSSQQGIDGGCRFYTIAYRNGTRQMFLHGTWNNQIRRKRSPVFRFLWLLKFCTLFLGKYRRTLDGIGGKNRCT